MLCTPDRQEVLRQEVSIGAAQVSNGNSLIAVPFLVIQGGLELREVPLFLTILNTLCFFPVHYIFLPANFWLFN